MGSGSSNQTIEFHNGRESLRPLSHSNLFSPLFMIPLVQLPLIRSKADQQPIYQAIKRGQQESKIPTCSHISMGMFCVRVALSLSLFVCMGKKKLKNLRDDSNQGNHSPLKVRVPMPGPTRRVPCQDGERDGRPRGHAGLEDELIRGGDAMAAVVEATRGDCCR